MKLNFELSPISSSKDSDKLSNFEVPKSSFLILLFISYLYIESLFTFNLELLSLLPKNENFYFNSLSLSIIF